MRRVILTAVAATAMMAFAGGASAQYSGRADNPELERQPGTMLHPAAPPTDPYWYVGPGTVGQGWGDRQTFDGTANEGNEPAWSDPAGRVNSHQQE